MNATLKYGRTERIVSIDDKANITILTPSRLTPLTDLSQALHEALQSPLGRHKIEELAIPSSVAIAVPDPSRPVPFRAMLPIILKKLYEAFPQLRPENITIVIGGGLHPPLSEKAAADWVPAALTPGCRLVRHDARTSSMMTFGTTSRGTPVEINAEFGRADLKIVIGQIDPHQLVGFTGGAKGAVVGCASARTIEHNHGLMFEQGAAVGNLQGNPFREDLNEAGRLAGVNFAVNAVVDPNKDIVGLWAGDPEVVLTEGAKVCAEVYGVKIDDQFDMAVASCGGYPKDMCLYQAQKGLNLCSHAVRPGGKIALLAACEEGVGDDVYLEYACRFESIEVAMADFLSHGFKMGAHKCYLFGKTLSLYEVVIESELDPAMLRKCHLRAGSAQEAVDRWVAEFPGRPRVAVVPNANTTYFQTR